MLNKILNVFFVLDVIRSYEFHLQSKTCLQFYCNFKFWICSNSFWDAGHDAQYIKQFLSVSMITECSFLWLLQLEAMKFRFIKNMPANWLKLQIFNLLKQFFRCRAWCVMFQTIFQYFDDYSTCFFVLIMIRSYKVHFALETHLGIYCNFKFWIFSNRFLALASGHDLSSAT